MHFTEYDTRLAAYGVVTRIDPERGEEILLALWNGPTPPKWTMPGGGVDWGEDVPTALHREFYEETGHQIAIGPILGVSTEDWQPQERMSESGRHLRTVRVIHAVSITGGDLGTTEVDGSTDEARWIPLADVRSLPHVSLVDAVLDLLGA